MTETNARRTAEARLLRIILLLLRISLGVGLLSAVADRFGIWGRYGKPSVAWGNFANFLAYTSQLAPWCPARLVPVLGWSVTVAETAIGLLMLFGMWVRPTFLFAAVLTMIFAISMTFALGVHAPLNYSVFVFSLSAATLGLLPNQKRSTD